MKTRALPLLRILALILVLGIPGLASAEGDVVSPRLARVLAQPAGPSLGGDGTYGIWVAFKDRDLSVSERDARLAAARGRLSQRTLSRRAKGLATGETGVSEADLPLAPRYLQAVSATGAELRRESRWLNAASFNATAEQIEIIRTLPFVTSLDLVARFKKRPLELSTDELAGIEAAKSLATSEKNLKWPLDYGGSLEQAELINLPPVHAAGLAGTGVVIGVIDTGFELDHQAMRNVDVIAAYDFVNDDADVSDGPSDPEYQAMHGTEVLSVIAGFEEGDLVGTAYKASFILAKTEDIAQETPQEEDNFIAALEWMEGLGVDVVSSQVGYVDWYYYRDMDGLTAPITLACDMAATLGVTVVTAVGNLNGEIGLPPLMAPADGRHVISVGSVSLNGVVVDNSSRGPTYDGRIKPDLMALGLGAVAGSWYADWVYTYQVGTSFATAQVAGVAALLLQRLPDLSPWQVREALRMTASHAKYPDNDYGWGIVDAKAALEYWGPVIEHEPLPYTDRVQPRQVTANVTSRQGIDPGSVILSWRTNLGDWKRRVMTTSGNDVYTGEIPAASTGAFVEYYIEAVDNAGVALTRPWAGNRSPYSYGIGLDAVAPTLDHTFLMDQRLADWPPVVWAEAADNTGISSVDLFYSVGGGPEQGPFPLVIDKGVYELAFPLDPAGLAVGAAITYRLTATDVAAGANTTEAGPFTFEIVDTRARVLVIDDLSENKSAAGEPDQDGFEGASALADKSAHSPSLIAGWLTDAGYQVDTVLSSQVKEGSFQGYQVVVLSSGQSFYPINYDELRSQLITYEARGGRILVEGGETGYVAGVVPGHPEFLEKVLHTAAVHGEGFYTFHPTMDMERHALLRRPHRLPNTLYLGLDPGQVDYRVSDAVEPTADAGLVYSGSFTSVSGGLLFHDDNTGPDQGQVVYFPFALNFFKEAVGRMLVENALAYLLAEELPGRSAIAGRVLLADGSDHSGITVSTDSLHSTVTDADGNYTLAGLWGGDVVLTVSKRGYGSRSLNVQLLDDQTHPAATLTLNRTVTLVYENSTATPIPDNSPAGVDIPIEVPASGAVHDLRVSVDISHYSINNLVVKLISPAGTAVTLHNRSGGTTDDLEGSWPDVLTVDGPGALEDLLGEDVLGTWTLNVSDNQFGAVGTVNSWGLSLEFMASGPTSVGTRPGAATRIIGNSPNPFNPRTVISFELARTGRVKLDIYDLRGRLVRTLADGDMAAGRHQVTWDGLDRSGKGAASGMYFSKLVAGGTSEVSKMTLVR